MRILQQEHHFTLPRQMEYMDGQGVYTTERIFLGCGVL